MSFAAEPYGVFVDDLVGSLTGGESRQRFVFLPENEPFQLGHEDPVPETLRIRGVAGGAFKAFSPLTDFQLLDGVVSWRSDLAGGPAADATWPDRGTAFYASYERVPDPQRPPRLTDRNPGSVTRTLAEAFALEFGTLSLQLDTVHKAAFVDTASGTDLDNVGRLVGVERRSQIFATGEVVFARSSPAAADIFLPEGLRISTGDVPALTVETTESRTLRAGTHSVTVPIGALQQGGDGIAAANTITVLHRPILGISSITNPEPLAFGQAETDEMLRRRIRRALKTGGRATLDAVVGALTSIEGVRAQDVLLTEDHLGFPGLVKVTVAAELETDQAERAAELIAEHRPAGVRFVHNLPLPTEAEVDPGPGGGGGGDGPITEGSSPSVETINENRYPIVAKAAITPGSANLTASQKQALIADVAAALESSIEAAGIEERVIYNRVVSDVMAVEGVYDAVLDIFPSGSATESGRVNLTPTAETRPDLVETDITLRGALVALDITVGIELVDAGLLNPVSEREQARDLIRAELQAGLATLGGGDGPHITQAALLGLLANTATYVIDGLSYQAEFLDEGLRVRRSNAEISMAGDQQAWLRVLTVQEQTAST